MPSKTEETEFARVMRRARLDACARLLANPGTSEGMAELAIREIERGEVVPILPGLDDMELVMELSACFERDDERRKSKHRPAT